MKYGYLHTTDSTAKPQCGTQAYGAALHITSAACLMSRIRSGFILCSPNFLQEIMCLLSPSTYPSLTSATGYAED
jgi:hypothetical protein